MSAARVYGSPACGALVHPPELDAFWVGVAVLLVALVLDGMSRVVAVASIRIGALLCFVASRLTRRNRQLLTNQSVPDRYVERPTSGASCP